MTLCVFCADFTVTIHNTLEMHKHKMLCIHLYIYPWLSESVNMTGSAKDVIFTGFQHQVHIHILTLRDLLEHVNRIK